MLHFAPCWGFAWRWRCGASQSTAASTGTAAAQEDSAQASTLEAGGTTALQLPQDGRKLI